MVKRNFEEYYASKNGNITVMISKNLAIQDKLFSKRENEIGYTINIDYKYRVDVDLYKLLKLIYGKNYK